MDSLSCGITCSLVKNKQASLQLLMQLHRLGHAFGEITGHALVKWRSRYREIIGHDAVKYPVKPVAY